MITDFAAVFTPTALLLVILGGVFAGVFLDHFHPAFHTVKHATLQAFVLAWIGLLYYIGRLVDAISEPGLGRVVGATVLWFVFCVAFGVGIIAAERTRIRITLSDAREGHAGAIAPTDSAPGVHGHPGSSPELPVDAGRGIDGGTRRE